MAPREITDADRRSVSAVVVNYNAGSLLTRCVTSVLSQRAGQVVVVDNASSDGSLSALERALPVGSGVHVLESVVNLGFAAACNVGAEASSGRYLLFLNPDARLEEGALDHMLQALNSAPDIGMVGGFLCNADGTEQAGGRRVIPTPRRALVRAFGLSSLAKIWPRVFSDFLLHREPVPSEPVPVEAISGACMLVKREAVEEVGFLDERYFLHCEDLDWCMRFRQEGWRTLFAPSARVTHYRGACSQSRPIFVEWHKHKGMIRFYRKYFRHKYPDALMGLVMAGVWFHFGLVCGYHAVRPARSRRKHASDWEFRTG